MDLRLAFMSGFTVALGVKEKDRLFDTFEACICEFNEGFGLVLHGEILALFLKGDV